MSVTRLVSLSPRAIVRRAGHPLPSDLVDLAATATVTVTSEQSAYPIDNVFDAQSGPGGSCWVAEAHGAQTICIAFHVAQRISEIVVESEERAETRSQYLDVSVDAEGDVPAKVEAPRLFRYSPYGPSFHRASWLVAPARIARVHVRVVPDPADRRASLTSIIVKPSRVPQ